MEKATEIKCDVLVIGGGAAGSWAAIRAKELTDDVILVEKSRVARSGMSTTAAGVFLYWIPGDDMQAWMEETCRKGAFLNNQFALEATLREGYDAVQEMMKWGMELEKDAAGVARVVGRSHQVTRLAMFHGHQMMETMRKEVRRRKVTLMERIMITDLLTSDGKHPTEGRVIGAVGFETRTGAPYVFKAKATILASGSIESKVGGHFCDNITGDSWAMGYRVGADITGMEFYPMGNLTVWERRFLAVGINFIQGHGLKLRNAKGEEFMGKYAPDVGNRANLYTLAQAMCKEALEGRGPIYADMRHFSAETIEKFKRVVPKTARIFEAAGIDITKQMVELTIGVRLRSPSCQGGVLVDEHCTTSVPGLWAIGAASKGASHGADEGAGALNLTWCFVSGKRSGQNAVKYAKETGGEIEVDPEQVKALLEGAFAPLKKKKGVQAEDVFQKVKEITIPAKYSVFKSERRVQWVLDELSQIEKNVLPELCAPDIHELVKVNEAKNYLLSAQMVYNASYQRKESRAYHYLQECPYMDNDEWLVWLVNRRTNGGMSFRKVPVPIDQYPIKPPRGRIPAPIQMTIPDE